MCLTRVSVIAVFMVTMSMRLDILNFNTQYFYNYILHRVFNGIHVMIFISGTSRNIFGATVLGWLSVMIINRGNTQSQMFSAWSIKIRMARETR